MGAGEVELITQKINQERTRIDCGFTRRIVYCQLNGNVHSLPIPFLTPPVSYAARSEAVFTARRVNTRTISRL